MAEITTAFTLVSALLYDRFVSDAGEQRAGVGGRGHGVEEPRAVR